MAGSQTPVDLCPTLIGGQYRLLYRDLAQTQQFRVMDFDTQFPGYTLTTQAQLQPLDLPGTALEQPLADKQRLNASAVLVRVTAAWGAGHTLVVTSLIGAPARRPNTTLTITQINGATPIPAHANAVFLPVILMLSLILLLLGLGFLNRRASQYQGAYQQTYSVMALQLAKAGLEEARVKLEKCGDFPPQSGLDQKSFSYTEILTPNQESYTITLDLSLRKEPFSIVRITSVGTSGPMDQPRARRVLSAELDVWPSLRSDPGTANPDYFQFVNFQDLGSL